MHMPKIAIVLAVHNRCKLTEEFLKSLFEQTFKDFVTIVVDDGSTDNTSNMITNKFPEVVLLKGDGNLWWAGATNLAIRHAVTNYKVDYICTVNDDTILDPSFLEGLYKTASIDPKRIVGGFSYDIAKEDQLLYDGSVVNWLTGKITCLNSTEMGTAHDALLELTYYIGRGVMIPSSVFSEVGYYDAARFPQSWADNELIFRAKRSGYKVYSTKNARQFIYSDESKHIKLKANKSLANYRAYLFKQQGGGNVIAFSKYIVRSYPWFGIPSSLVGGVLRRVMGYWLP